MVWYSSPVARRAIVTKVNYDDGVIHTRWLDEEGSGPIVPIPHPLANRGGSGVYVGIKVGSQIILSMGAYKSYYPVAVLPTMSYYDSDISSIQEADYDDIGFPKIKTGEVVLQGSTGSQIRLNNSDNSEEVSITNEFNEGIKLGGGSDSFRCSIYNLSPTNYIIAPYGIEASGIIRRDVKIEDSEESFVDFLNGLDSEQSLEEIGWDPSKQVSYLSGGLGESTKGQTGGTIYRNPAFVEKRNIIYEFGRDWNVGTFDEEKSYLESSVPPVPDSENRSERRSNVLGLSLYNPNELMESISGTAIDIFGNMIDINRRIIETPVGDDITNLITNTFEQSRHTVAYHMEINARKGIRFDNSGQSTNKPVSFIDPTISISSVANNARDRSRWFIDVDKEGLTKINIPATSETGNIPVLARYENSSVIDISVDGNPNIDGRDLNDTKKLFRNEKGRDIFTEQFGPGGITINGNAPDNRMSGKKTNWIDDGDQKIQPTMKETIEAGTAFHDITQTAWALIRDNLNKSADDVIFNGATATERGLRAISKEINANIPTDRSEVASRPNDSGLLEGQPNAGGRSLNMNLDGSMETSIGANTIDRVSWILDTAGALIWRLGRDRAGRSAIIHADGTVALEVGGFDYIGQDGDDEVDTRFVGKGTGNREDVLKLDKYQFRSGKVVLKIRRSKPDNSGPEEDDTLLIIDESGITIDTPGRLNLISGQDMSLTSKSRVIIDAPKVQVYRENPKYFARTARLIK